MDKERSIVEKNVNAAFAEWGKYIFSYSPQQKCFTTSKYAEEVLGAPEKITDFNDNIFISFYIRTQERL